MNGPKQTPSLLKAALDLVTLGWLVFPLHSIWLGTNHKPEIKGVDHAIWRRVRLIPFGVTFHDPSTRLDPVKDTTLGKKLESELPGILRWAVEGCLAWQKNGLLPSESVLEATSGYKAEMDRMTDFINDCCELSPKVKVQAGVLYLRYKQWCSDNGESHESQKKFGQRIVERGFVRFTSNGKRYRGLTLNDGTDGMVEPKNELFKKHTSGTGS